MLNYLIHLNEVGMRRNDVTFSHNHGTINMNRNNSFDEAVTIVRNKLSPDSAKIISYSISQNEENASVLGGVGFGVAMRNLLAENGMIWEEVVLFSVWFAILKEAVRTIIES